MAYLYGASVQGIQDFILKTNKLQEIVGASEIVKSIESVFEGNYKAEEVLVNAAGNIKAIMDEESCKQVVLEFPKMIMENAYGITISQAVVKINGTVPTQEEINQLEERLKVKRNRVETPLDLSLNITELNPSTAKPIVGYINSKPVDRAIKQKIEANKKFFDANPRVKEFKDISEMSNGKNKIAVIHADGNGLGMLIPKLHKQGIKLSEFSKKLDEATKSAYAKSRTDEMSIRDMILSGDDMAVICNANDALQFTRDFLHHFEQETQQKLGYKLTACAGIAYCNEKYPFHYAYALAEELCVQTKKHAKNIDKDLAPSSLMFHNIQSSNYQSWDMFVEQELTIKNDKETIYCDFGPYYLSQESQPKIDDFINTLEAYRCDGSPISRLREWIGELHKSSQYASSILSRINEMAKKSEDWNSCIMDKNLENFNSQLSNENLIIEKDGKKKTPIYDILQILSATEAK